MDILRFYLNFQKIRFYRRIKRMQMGVPLGIILLLSLFATLSCVLFFEVKHYHYFYLFLAINIPISFCNPKHVDFLKRTYSKSDYYRIRLTENIALALPFGAMLLLSGYIFSGLSLLIVSLITALYTPKIISSYAVPTPFYKNPFEFIVGFRLSFALIFLGYYLTYISFIYSNFYLSIFVVLAFSVLGMMYYIKVEETYFVWIYQFTPKAFLFSKVKQAVYSLLLLCLPVIVVLAVMRPTGVFIILGFMLGGIGMLATGVFCKYSSFPEELSLRQSMLLLFSVLFPVLILFTLPYFYIQARRQLKEILL